MRAIACGPESAEVNHLLVGVDIGGTKTAVVLSRPAAHTLARRVPDLPPARAEACACKAASLIRQSLAESGSELNLTGVSCGGPLDRIRGIIQAFTQPAHMGRGSSEGDPGIRIRCAMRARERCECSDRTPIRCRPGLPNLVFLTLDTGLGAGLIPDGLLTLVLQTVFHYLLAPAGEFFFTNIADGNSFRPLMSCAQSTGIFSNAPKRRFETCATFFYLPR